MSDPERKYNRFVQHAQTCPMCKATGNPEAADAEQLCYAGRALRQQWATAEERAAVADRVG